MPTLMTDPRSGGVKKSSGVNVLPIVAETWTEVRNESNRSIDWLLAGYDGTSKTDITILRTGNGGMDACCSSLPSSIPVFGGVRLNSGRFGTFFYADASTSVMKKGRASMHKNGVFNVLVGSDGEIDNVQPNFSNSGNDENQPGVADVPEEPALPQVTNEERKVVVDQTTRAFSKITLNDTANDTAVIPSYANKSSRVTKQALNNAAPSTPSRTSKNMLNGVSSPQTSFGKKRGNMPSTITTTVPSAIDTETQIEEEAKATAITSDNDMETFPYSDLKGVTDLSTLPSGVDPTKKEYFLSDQEFSEVFGMDKHTFYDMPAWKRNVKKKAVLLF